MKILHVVIVMIVGIALLIAGWFFLAVGNNLSNPISKYPLELINVTSIPYPIVTGKSFQIYATIINNGSDEITYSKDCSSPISVHFDNDLQTYPGESCTKQLLYTIEPNSTITISSSPIGLVYNSTYDGMANATITFNYKIKDKIENLTTYKEFLVRPAPLLSERLK
ncbi:MAG TPA: hypothetical protein VFX64_01940 [Candidatus Nitrosotalea sp.]|nr:hypothetical protein [Candidatus Nitrosotalea sp.]